MYVNPYNFKTFISGPLSNKDALKTCPVTSQDLYYKVMHKLQDIYSTDSLMFIKYLQKT